MTVGHVIMLLEEEEEEFIYLTLFHLAYNVLNTIMQKRIAQPKSRNKGWETSLDGLVSHLVKVYTHGTACRAEGQYTCNLTRTHVNDNYCRLSMMGYQSCEKLVPCRVSPPWPLFQD